MFGLTEYRAVSNLEEAYRLLMENKNNAVLGGLLWMKMGKKQYHTGIDLSPLGLGEILETQDTIDIGCMTTLRQMETSKLLHHWFGTLFSDAFRNIVGVQFRNLATLGGSVYSRFGFSDVICALSALNARVHLYQAGSMPLSDFLGMDQKRDILIKVEIPKKKAHTSYQALRKTATDFPLLCVSASLCRGQWRIAVGARPSRAVLAEALAAALPLRPDEKDLERALDGLKHVSFGTDQRAGAAYRQTIARVLVKRGIEAICRSYAG